jgi:hypothetical protein
VAWFNSGPGDKPQNGAAWQLGFDLAAGGRGRGADAGARCPDAGRLLRGQDRSWLRSAGVARAKGGEAAPYRGDHEYRPCLLGDIHYPAASGQGFVIADEMVSS